VQYAYNTAGDTTSMTDVGTGATTYAYDTYGRLASFTKPFAETTSFTYDGAGRVSRKTLANGTYEDYAYDALSRVTSINTKNSGGTVLAGRSYVFDLASQVTSVVEGTVTTTYGYDNAGQLTSEAKSSGYSATYTYDGNGNRLTRAVNGVLETYAYDNGDKLLSVTGGSDPRTFTYDAAGRTTGIVRGSGTTAFTYDYEGRVTQVTRPGMVTNTATYNGLDTRVTKIDSGGAKTFKRAGVGVTAPVLSDGAATYTPGTSERRSGTSTFFNNGLQNTDVQTSTNQTMTATRQYDAWGNLLASSGPWKSPFGSAGQFGNQEEQDTGLKLLGHRYYDSSTGRFLTRDPANDGRNWYNYCDNNPVGAIDASGLRRLVVRGDDKGDALIHGFYDFWRKNHGYQAGGAKGKWEGDRDIDNPTRDEFIKQLIDAPDDTDVLFYGHGGNDGHLRMKNGEAFLQRDLQYVIDQRRKMGKGKLGKLTIDACDSMSKAEYVNRWLDLGKEVEGFGSGSTEPWSYYRRKAKIKNPNWTWGNWWENEDTLPIVRDHG